MPIYCKCRIFERHKRSEWNEVSVNFQKMKIHKIFNL